MCLLGAQLVNWRLRATHHYLYMLQSLMIIVMSLNIVWELIWYIVFLPFFLLAKISIFLKKVSSVSYILSLFLSLLNSRLSLYFYIFSDFPFNPSNISNIFPIHWTLLCCLFLQNATHNNTKLSIYVLYTASRYCYLQVTAVLNHRDYSVLEILRETISHLAILHSQWEFFEIS